MNDDLIDQAKEMSIKPNSYAPSEIRRMLGSLVDEIKHLQSQIEKLSCIQEPAQIAKLEADRRALMSDNVLTDRIRELEQLAIQERARCLYNKAMYGTGYDLPNGINEFMDQAAKELALEAAQAALDKLRAGT